MSNIHAVYGSCHFSNPLISRCVSLALLTGAAARLPMSVARDPASLWFSMLDKKNSKE